MRTPAMYVAAGSYHGRCGCVAREVKTGSPEALRKAARLLAPSLPPGAVLIPIPSHTGRADSNLALCRLLAADRGCTVCDCLECRPHESLHALKVRERETGAASGSLMPRPEALGFRLLCGLPEGPHVLIDNVIASGTTALAAERLIPDAVLHCVADDEGYPKAEKLEKVQYCGKKDWKSGMPANRKQITSA